MRLLRGGYPAFALLASAGLLVGCADGAGSSSTAAGERESPRVKLRLARGRDAGGWYNGPVRVTAEVRHRRRLVEVCFWAVPTYPSGVSTSSVSRPCPDPKGRSFAGAAELGEEAVYAVQLIATDDLGREGRAQLVVPTDFTAPRSTFASVPRALPRRVVIEGEAADASSGAARVTLKFVGPGGRFERDATCGCPGGVRRQRPAEPWRFEGDVPPGRWRVHVAATDHAANLERDGPAVDVDVA